VAPGSEKRVCRPRWTAGDQDYRCGPWCDLRFASRVIEYHLRAADELTGNYTLDAAIFSGAAGSMERPWLQTHCEQGLRSI